MIYVSTHAGKRHRTSEDAVLVGSDVIFDASTERPMPKNGFICIADGVGGNRCGDQAAQFVLKALSEVSYDTDEGLKNNLRGINESLISTALSEGVAPDMAATLTGFFFDDNLCRLVHVGNTRAYVRQGKYLKQITSDHTTYNWLLSSGQLDAAERCNKSEITNCFGGRNPALLSKLFITECQQFSLALLTSDGVHEYVDIDSLEEIVSGEDSLSDICEEIIQRAIEAGSEDDLTVVIICPSEE